MEDKYQKYKNIAFSSGQWYIIRKAIDEDIDVSDIANPRFTEEQLQMLIDARRAGVDLTGLVDPDLSEEQLKRILDKIYKEMGLYEAHYENVRRKWLKNTTWITVFISICILIAAVLLATKDSWMKYFEELYLQFNCEVAVIEAGDIFKPENYIKAYDPEAEVDFPNQEEINTKKPGNYWAIYHISNGKKEKELKLLVKVQDTKKPEIVLKENKISIREGEVIEPKDYLIKAVDNVDGEIKNLVEIRKEDNSYIYEVTDSSGNSATETLKVSVIKEKKSESKPSVSDYPDDKKQNEPQSEPMKSSQVIVTAPSMKFPFEEGKSFEQTYQECMNTGNAAASSGQANQASCTVYDDENGIHKGYLLSYR